MILHINEAISSETVDKIAKPLNELKKGEKLFIYFSSLGGEVHAAEAIIHIINSNIDIIEMAGYGDLMSAGFDIFFRSKCPRILLPNCIGMFHQSTVMIEINESSKPYEGRSQAEREWMRLQKELTVKLCTNLGMTDKEIAAIKKGKDVYFQYKRMQEFLKAQQI